MTQPNTPPPPHPDPLVIDWLLTALCRRLYFSAEMGVLACLEYPPARFAEFVDAHVARPTRAVAEVLRLAASDSGSVAAAKPLDGLVLCAEMLAATLLTVGGFRALSADQLRAAVDRFAGAWFSLRGCIEEVAAALGVEVACLRDLDSPQERGARNTLNILFSELECGRAAPG